MYALLLVDAHRNLVDFDNHFDNISLDWQNQKLNKLIDGTIEKK